MLPDSPVKTGSHPTLRFDPHLNKKSEREADTLGAPALTSFGQTGCAATGDHRPPAALSGAHTPFLFDGYAKAVSAAPMEVA